MIGLIGAVGRVGAVGGARTPVPMGTADFTLSNASVATAWGIVTVGQLLPVGAPAGSYFVLVESPAVSGDDAGLAVVNG